MRIDLDLPEKRARAGLTVRAAIAPFAFVEIRGFGELVRNADFVSEATRANLGTTVELSFIPGRRGPLSVP